MNSVFNATFDYICHQLKCPRCGEVTLDPCDIDLQTKLALVKELRTLYVGDRLELAPNPKETGGYLETREIHTPGRISVIEAWSCPKCGAGFLWARVVFEGGVLKCVESVELTEDILSSVDYITSEVLMLIPVEKTIEVKQLSPNELRAELLSAEAKHLEEQDKSE